MKINPISTIPFTNQLRIKLESKFMTGGGHNPTPMDKIFRIVDLDNCPLFISKDVFILNPLDKTKERLADAGIDFEEVGDVINYGWVEEIKKRQNNKSKG